MSGHCLLTQRQSPGLNRNECLVVESGERNSWVKCMAMINRTYARFNHRNGKPNSVNQRRYQFLKITRMHETQTAMNIVKVITALVSKNRIKRELEARRTDQIWVISSHWRRANRPFERNNSKFFSPLFRSRLLCSMAKRNGCNDHKGKSNITRFLENKTKENESKARKLQFATFAIFWGSLRLEECLMTSGSSGKLGHRHTIKVVRPLL